MYRRCGISGAVLQKDGLEREVLSQRPDVVENPSDRIQGGGGSALSSAPALAVVVRDRTAPAHRPDVPGATPPNGEVAVTE